ncbi:flagellar filament capping protein FliD [Thiomicrorhabdus sp. zzn3]|uniref:flagellar filament capping protein FliD n=1 Tax=Thiomicrorhabdus sp. zzn3 TaxID=3039775 RepID=UPI0024371A66|nr:flagellar filament capping protein FliD [Thiomicrorhabdus sp. zzn3]MDG6777625.1 flagellar filament capping protein FliD [Thiomicrorhabdus sp. zzn3]
MANEIGNALLTSLTNSSFDIGNMSKVLAEAEVAGPRAILEKNQEKVSTELDALKYLKTNLEAFNTYLTDLSSPDTFGQKNVTSSNDGIVSVSASSTAALASYQIESKQLAQAHTLVANQGYSSPSDTISAGTLSIQVGGQSHSITVDASNNTLEGLQKVINNGDYGVTASIINNGGSYQMMFTSKETGAAGEVSISGLADFDTAGFTTTAEAQDAVMVLNGLTVTSSTNTFDSVIEGVSFQLNSASPGVMNAVSVGQDSEGVKEAITSFVDVYNQLDTILDELGSYSTDELTAEELESEEYQYYGDLAGSSLLRSVKYQVRESLSGAMEMLSGSSYQSLTDIGISFDREGKLVLDSAKLDSAISSDMQAVSSLFSKGGSSSDPLINVISGGDNTQTGNYDLNITQLAERAAVTGGAAIFSTDQRLSGDRVIDSTAALTIDAGASFTLDVVGGPNAGTFNVDLTAVAGTYASKDEVAAAIQSQLGGAPVTVAYDSAQSRFEITANAGEGSVTLSNIVGLNNQGFSQASYAGENLIDLSGADATFNVKIDDATASAVTIQAGRYTLDELSQTMATSINNNADVKAAGAQVSVTNDGNAMTITSSRFGAFSTVELTGFTGFASAGFTADLTDVGQNVDGTITTASGTLNIGAYADAEDGRLVKISDYAVIAGNPAEVQGLQFEVLGGLTGARGTITYEQGFASKLEETIGNLFDSDYGLIGQRIDSLNNKMDKYSEKSDDIDARYERLLMKYQLQFSALQSIISSTEQTRNYLSATFSNNNNNN